jgi:hypothetical protein
MARGLSFCTVIWMTACAWARPADRQADTPTAAMKRRDAKVRFRDMMDKGEGEAKPLD